MNKGHNRHKENHKSRQSVERLLNCLQSKSFILFLPLAAFIAFELESNENNRMYSLFSSQFLELPLFYEYRVSVHTEIMTNMLQCTDFTLKVDFSQTSLNSCVRAMANIAHSHTVREYTLHNRTLLQ